MSPTQRERAVRSDSTRNRDAIIDAAVLCLARDPAASLADIATTAGVGRVTLYGHFASRSDLIGAVVERTMHRAESKLSALDLAGDPWTAMDSLVGTSWQLVHELNALLGVAEHALPASQIRDSHDRPMQRVQALLARGRSAGAFRTDQSVEWQIACFYAILHGAAAEIRADRLSQDDAVTVLPQTIRALLRPVA